MNHFHHSSGDNRKKIPLFALLGVCRKPCSLHRSRYSTEISYISIGYRLVVGGGFEPPKASPTDLQSVPFGRSGTPPYAIIEHCGLGSADGGKLNPKSDSPGPTLFCYIENGNQMSLQTIRAVDAPEGPKSKFYLWSQRRDSNPRPTDYKSVALPAELRWLHNLRI